MTLYDYFPSESLESHVAMALISVCQTRGPQHLLDQEQ